MMATKNHKTHPIHKEQKKQISKLELESCQKFRIRPTVISTPIIRINEQLTKFRVKVKQIKMEKFQITLKNQQNKKNESENSSPKNEGKPRMGFELVNKNSKYQGLEKSCKSQSNSKKQDLSVYSLHQIISTMYTEGLMLKYYFEFFDNNFDESDEKKVLLSFENRKQTRSFKQTLFTIIDHRIFAQCLVICCGNRYYIGENFGNQGGEICDYYQKVYSKQLSEYLEEWDAFNRNYHRTWMPKSVQLFKNMQYFRQKHPNS